MQPSEDARLLEPVHAALKLGPCTLGVLLARVRDIGAPSRSIAGVLLALRELSGQGKVRCARFTNRRGEKVGPVFWFLSDEDVIAIAQAMRPARTPAPLVELADLGQISRKGHDDTPPGPMEVLGRLAGRTSFTDMGGARGTSGGMTADEIDFVLRFGAPDPLGRELAFAIACMSPAPWRRVYALGRPHLLGALARDRLLAGSVRGPFRFRVRIILSDVFQDLVRRRNAMFRERALMWRMREETYRKLYTFVECELKSLAETAAQSAIDTLFGRVQEWDDDASEVPQRSSLLRIERVA